LQLIFLVECYVFRIISGCWVSPTHITKIMYFYAIITIFLEAATLVNQVTEKDLTFGVLLNHCFYEPDDTFKVKLGTDACFLSTHYEENCKQ
jgi:hypothetical protein